MTSPPSWQPKQWKKPRAGVDVERRRLLVVERAQPLQGAAAGVAQRDVLRDDLVDARLLAHLGDVLLADPACHVAESTSGWGRRSVVAGHDVGKRLAGGVPVQLVADQAVARAATSRCSRRRRAARSAGSGRSQSGLSAGSGSRVGHVDGGARSARSPSAATRSSVSTTAPRGDVDQQRAVLHPGQEARVDQAAGLVGRAVRRAPRRRRRAAGRAAPRWRARRRARCGRPGPPRPRTAAAGARSPRPIAPYPTSSTRLSASAGCQPDSHSRRSWARTKPGTPRSDWPGSGSAPARRSTCRGCRGRCRAARRRAPFARMLSTPAVSVCTTSRLVIRGSTSAPAGPTAYGGT